MRNLQGTNKVHAKHAPYAYAYAYIYIYIYMHKMFTVAVKADTEERKILMNQASEHIQREKKDLDSCHRHRTKLETYE